MPPQRVVLRWSAYEHEHIERESNWYWALGIVAVCAALIAVLFSDVLFALLVLVAAATLGMLASVRPEMIDFEISDRGVRVDGTLHRFNHIISFWVEDEHLDHYGRPLLLVDTTKFLAPNLIIPIEDIDPHVIRAFLKQHSKEVHMKEPLSHKILEFVGM
jgi:hypothetical protein